MGSIFFIQEYGADLKFIAELLPGTYIRNLRYAAPFLIAQ